MEFGNLIVKLIINDDNDNMVKITIWPGFVALDLLGWEKFEWPSAQVCFECFSNVK